MIKYFMLVDNIVTFDYSLRERIKSSIIIA